MESPEDDYFPEEETDMRGGSVMPAGVGPPVMHRSVLQDHTMGSAGGAGGGAGAAASQHTVTTTATTATAGSSTSTATTAGAGGAAAMASGDHEMGFGSDDDDEAWDSVGGGGGGAAGGDGDGDSIPDNVDEQDAFMQALLAELEAELFEDLKAEGPAWCCCFSLPPPFSPLLL